MALVGQAEDITNGIPAISVKVKDVGAVVESIVSAGGTVVRPLEFGPHELRAVVSDPFGNTMVVYGD